MKSFVCDDEEWTIYNYSKDSDVFSAKGDPGSLLINGQVRIGSILTSGYGYHTIHVVDLASYCRIGRSSMCKGIP